MQFALCTSGRCTSPGARTACAQAAYKYMHVAHAPHPSRTPLKHACLHDTCLPASQSPLPCRKLQSCIIAHLSTSKKALGLLQARLKHLEVFFACPAHHGNPRAALCHALFPSTFILPHYGNQMHWRADMTPSPAVKCKTCRSKTTQTPCVRRATSVKPRLLQGHEP